LWAALAAEPLGQPGFCPLTGLWLVKFWLQVLQRY